MKLFTKLFVAVAALGAFSCATDVTENLGVDLGGQTTITLSLEESRTQLGEKAGEVYPVLWSEGDQISVNGVASAPLTASQAGKSKAEFTVNGTHTDYNIAYPAASEGEVIFANKQTHAGNTTFGKGVSTIYGVGSSVESVELHHLTGVLKIGVTGSATLTKAVISTADRAAIAGPFAIDFTTGKVTPTASATPVIEYEFATPLALSNEVTYMHIAVPEGVYDELYVTLHDNAGGVRTATVSAGDKKPLNAGAIRTFSSDIAYSANTSATIIKTADELIAWAAGAETSTKDAILAADIDMSGKSWTPVNGFPASFLGNGHSIKGLKAPLFGTTTAKAIKGVHLTDVDITITNLTDAGPLICYLNNPDAELSHCSATGKMTININKIAQNAWNHNYYGGLIGCIGTSKEAHDLYSNVKIVVPSTSVSKGLMYITNLCGNGDDNAHCSLRDCVCHGTIEFNGTTGGNGCYLGAFVSSRAKNITNCVNGIPDSDGTAGSITVSSKLTKNLLMSGCSVFINGTTVKNCHNYGNLTAHASGEVNAGGLVHSIRSGSMTDCSNHGKITITKSSTDNHIRVGGIAASDDGGAADQVNNFVRCNNYGDIEITSTATPKYMGCGGLLGRRDIKNNTITFDECNNYGKITVAATIINNTHIGGLVGLVGAADKPAKEFRLKNCANYGDLEMNITAKVGSGKYYRIGGAIGTLVYPMTDVEGYVKNMGKITCAITNNTTSNPGNGDTSCGGIIGFTSATNGVLNLKNLKLHNGGNMKLEYVSGTPVGFYGAIVGSLGTPGALQNASCNCLIEQKGLDGHVGMIMGSAYAASAKATNCQVAGGFITGYKQVVDEQADEVYSEPIVLKITAANMQDYLYGGGAITAEQATTDNITLYTE